HLSLVTHHSSPFRVDDKAWRRDFNLAYGIRRPISSYAQSRRVAGGYNSRSTIGCPVILASFARGLLRIENLDQAFCYRGYAAVLRHLLPPNWLIGDPI